HGLGMMKSFFFLMVVSVAGWADFRPADRPYDVENYRLTLRLDPAEAAKEFTARVEIRLRAKKAVRDIELDRRNLKIARVTRVDDDTALTFANNDPDRLRVTLP